MDFLKQKKNDIIDKCPLCNGEDSLCQCYKDFSLVVKKHNSQIPNLFIDSDLSKVVLDQRKIDCINGFLNGDFGGLYIEGGGKTQRTALMSAILSEFLKKDKTCLMVDATDIARHESSKWVHKKEDESLDVDVLSINDLGDERKLDSNIVEDSLDILIRDRLFGMQKLLIASSYPIELFAKTYTKDRNDLIAKRFRVITLKQVDVSKIFADIRK